MTTIEASGSNGHAIQTRQPRMWPSRIGLLDEDGQPLGEADLRSQDGETCLLLGEVAKPDALLSYYFGKSGRRLMLDLGDRTVNGWLETRWDGGQRVWWVELQQD